ncbi:MAG: D-alanine--D-alanine ligase [Hyphomicrobiales bacterium]|nr:MAG: D-alanine--D-alanine ligase [Hyphomicrobiales bacterium]
MAQPKHIAVLMGGWSSERPVSLASAKPCAQALRDSGYKVTEVDMARDIAAVLVELKPDVVFNALHGPYGEDGTIQGVLEILDIPYTHSGVMASALAMNKEIAKSVMAAAGIPVAEAKTMQRAEAAKKHAMKPPYVVKPVSEGSSFGVVIVSEDMNHPPQQLFASDWPYGETVMVERYIPGHELTCAVMDGKALGVTEVLSNSSKFYDYDAKYSEGGSDHVLPAQIPAELYEKIQKYSELAHECLGCRGISRADFRYDDSKDDLICLELNTQPGMTPTSLVPEMAVHAGYDFGAFVSWMVEDASCNR